MGPPSVYFVGDKGIGVIMTNYNQHLTLRRRTTYIYVALWRSLTLRRLMSYIYGAPILDVSRSHNDAAQSVGLLWTSDQLVAETST